MKQTAAMVAQLTTPSVGTLLMATSQEASGGNELKELMKVAKYTKHQLAAIMGHCGIATLAKIQLCDQQFRNQRSMIAEPIFEMRWRHG